MTDSVIACDACGQMVYANFAARTLFGEIDMNKNSIARKLSASSTATASAC